MVTAKSLVRNLPVAIQEEYTILSRKHADPLASLDNRVLTELERMLVDIEQHGVMASGKDWKMVRPLGTHWCGYLLNPGYINDELYDELDKIAHWEFTSQSPLGFDCAHYKDFCSILSNFYDGTTYKDYAFVLDVIKRLIDMIIDYRN